MICKPIGTRLVKYDVINIRCGLMVGFPERRQSRIHEATKGIMYDNRSIALMFL